MNKFGIQGINQILLKRFKNDDNLKIAIKRAKPIINSNKEYNNLQRNIMNFYNKDTIVPYIPVSAQGPWIVTNTGSVLYDVGGYGMLGFGHSPQWCLDVLSKPHVMANVMTPNTYQLEFTELLKKKIGINRNNECPYSHFAFLNSGSEAMELALRISDIDNKIKKESAFIVLKNSFHGRTTKAATISDSSRKNYEKNLKSFKENKNVHTVFINSINSLKYTFQNLQTNYHVEALIMEPVMGEGNPGIPLTTDYYKYARELTKKNNTNLIIDSVQAGLRTYGYLSVVDYPHLKELEAPDMEIFSKAISSGHFPLSVLAVNKKINENFKTGIYGNTMTGNPKAMEMGIETLKRVTPQLTDYIQNMGIRFKNMLYNILKKYPEIVTNVTGTGLLLALHIKEQYKVDEKFGLEYLCRVNGLNVIHGGSNSLRFTPYFLITPQEIDLIQHILNLTFKEYKNNYINK